MLLKVEDNFPNKSSRSVMPNIIKNEWAYTLTACYKSIETFC
jgi:hypothetical protein